MAYTAAVISVSDKGAAGERVDTSGPALRAILEERGYTVSYSSIIPDGLESVSSELKKCADELGLDLILTTGGTGFSPRDLSPEATLAVLERRTPGIQEAMRAESLRLTPRGCLSRGEAGIRGRSLIINLPGSEKAARENLLAVIDALDHGLEMLLGGGSADCGGHHHHHEHPNHGGKKAPSLDAWLREARGDKRIGMYLIHNGVVRGDARAKVREGAEDTLPVKALRFSYDEKKLREAEAAALAMPGIYLVRTWLNEGEVALGGDLMYVMVGGDIRPNVTEALQSLLERIKRDCVREEEIY